MPSRSYQDGFLFFMYLAEVLLSSPVATVYPDRSGLRSRFCLTVNNCVVPNQTGNLSKVRTLYIL